MKTFFCLCFLLFAFASSIHAQDTLPLNATWRDSARFYIRDLKEGVLVVRLQTRSKAIQQLNKEGNYAAANNILQAQRKENLETIQAFRTKFSFCKVYFFFSDSTDAWMNGRRSGYFLNDSLVIDPSIQLKENFSLLAEKGSPEHQNAYDKTQPDLEQKEPGYLNETIVVRDKNLHMLKDPFPYYAQEPFPENVFARNWKSKVESLNRKLNNFYKINWK